MDKQNQISTYIVLETLGRGTYSTVKLGIDENRKYVAIKQFHPDKADLDQIYDEITVLKSLDHPNIVKVIDWKEEAQMTHKNGEKEYCSALITEYFSGGNLYQIIDHSGMFSQKIARTYFLQIIKALKYIHEAGFVHLDIKPQNIMLSERYELKIVDFGLSCLKNGFNGTGFLKGPAGSNGFQSPELIKGEYEGTNADIFAAAITLFFMYARNYPFDNATARDSIYKYIIGKKQHYFWQITQGINPNVNFSEDFKDLFTKMIKFNPSQRITISGILSHPWMKGEITSNYKIELEFNERKQKMDKKKKELKKIQEKKQKQHLNGYMDIEHFSMMRGSDDISNELLELIQKQKDNKRQLGSFDQKFKSDIILDKEANQSYAVARLKELLINLQINLRGGQFEPINYEVVPVDNLLHHNRQLIEKISLNEIEAEFQRIIQLDDDDLIQKIKVKILIGKDYYQRIVFRLLKISGNEYGFRRIFSLVKNTFAYVTDNKEK